MRELIKRQISKSLQEITFVRFTFSIFNCCSLIFIYFCIKKLPTLQNNSVDKYLVLAQATAALFAPYLTMIAQGYCYPRMRKINVLRFLLFKRTLTEEEKNKIYEA